MTGRKLDRGAFEAQFHNHDHYEDSDDIRDAVPEWYELPKPTRPFKKGGAVEHALKIVEKRR